MADQAPSGRAALLQKLAQWLPSPTMGADDPDKAADAAKARGLGQIEGRAPAKPGIKVPIVSKEF